jgi:hypothetical protein
VTWLNPVDQSYREEFRDLFEANFERVEARLRELDARVDSRLERFEARVAEQLADVRLEAKAAESRLLRWMFAVWVTTLLSLAGTTFAVWRLR